MLAVAPGVASRADDARSVVSATVPICLGDPARAPSYVSAAPACSKPAVLVASYLCLFAACAWLRLVLPPRRCCSGVGCGMSLPLGMCRSTLPTAQVGGGFFFLNALHGMLQQRGAEQPNGLGVVVAPSMSMGRTHIVHSSTAVNRNLDLFLRLDVTRCSRLHWLAWSVPLTVTDPPCFPFLLVPPCPPKPLPSLPQASSSCTTPPWAPCGTSSPRRSGGEGSCRAASWCWRWLRRGCWM